MPSPSTSPESKVLIAKPSKTTGSSWPRPSKAVEAAVTIRSPLFDGAKEKRPLQSNTEQTSTKHQLLPVFPLASLSTISELPKLELLEGIPSSDPPASTHSARQTGCIEQEELADAAQPNPSGSMDEQETRTHEIQGSPKVSSTLPFTPPVKAASIPLPLSPFSDDEITPADSRPPLGSEHDAGSPRQLDPLVDDATSEVMDKSKSASGGDKNTASSGIASILPQWIADQLPRQDSGMVYAQASRSPSIFPGAYPESDSMEDTPIPTPGPIAEASQAGAGQSRTSLQRSADKSMRPRKSVSIALPNTDEESGMTQDAQSDSTQSKNDKRSNLASSRPEVENNQKIEGRPNPEENSNVQHERPREARLDSKQEEHAVTESKQDLEKDQGKTHRSPCAVATTSNEIWKLTPLDPKDLAPQKDRDLFLRPSQTSGRREGSPSSRASSIAISQKETEAADTSTLHERESLAPSDADNSSLLPLLSSSPRDAHSSRFSESLDDNELPTRNTKSGKQPEAVHRAGTDSPPIVDDLSSLSTIDSSKSSEAEGLEMRRTSEYTFPPADNGEGPSHTASSLPTPKIVVKDASEAEDSLHSPPLRAPTTTPVQGSTPPRRTATFAALGEASDHQGPVKLPMKRRKLYVRKARYVVLRQPILNAVLGRQVGAQTKSALKKLANGELIIMEPPMSL